MEKMASSFRGLRGVCVLLFFTPLCVAEEGVAAIGPGDGLESGFGEFDLERGEGVIEVMHLAGADDGRGDAGRVEQPGEGDAALERLRDAGGCPGERRRFSWRDILPFLRKPGAIWFRNTAICVRK